MTGAFDYNATNQTAVAPSGILFSGDTNFVFGNITVNSPTSLAFDDINLGASDFFTFNFAQSLDLGGTDAIIGGSVPFFTIATSGSVTATESQSVPEPFTIAIFSAGLFGAAAMRRRQKKA